METISGLLTVGNGKLGESIHVWSLPAVSTCPGRTPTCTASCYATKGRFILPTVKDRLDRNYRASLVTGFPDRMAREIRRKGCQVIRVHVSGDFYSPEYAEHWLWVMRNRPKPRYYFYTRSFRVPGIAPFLERMSELRCCRVWYSTDRDSHPGDVPPSVRVAYLQVADEEEPEAFDLRFVVRRLRKHRRSLPLLCPQEYGTAANCGDCGLCFR